MVVGKNKVVGISKEVREKWRNGKKCEVFWVAKCSFRVGFVLLNLR